MSAQENKRLMQDIFSKLATGDGSMYVEHLADDVVMRITGHNSWSQTFNGKESLIRNMYGYVRSLTQDPRKTIPVHIIADGNHVVVEARGEAIRKDGIRYDNDYCLVFRLKDNKIVEIREYLDSALCERVLGRYPSSTVQN